MAEESSWTRVNRRCPHCGARSQTLGSVCPACGRSYAPPGLLDRLPLIGDDGVHGFAAFMWVVVALMLFAGFVYGFMRSWVAGTIVGALLLAGFVAAIGITNWLAER